MIKFTFKEPNNEAYVFMTLRKEALLFQADIPEPLSQQNKLRYRQTQINISFDIMSTSQLFYKKCIIVVISSCN